MKSIDSAVVVDTTAGIVVDSAEVFVGDNAAAVVVDSAVVVYPLEPYDPYMCHKHLTNLTIKNVYS